jgi:hypothetical protein
MVFVSCIGLEIEVEGNRINPVALAWMQSLFFADSFERRLVRFHVHELPVLGIPLDPVTGRHLGLGALFDSADAVAVTDWGIFCHEILLVKLAE